ncbi:hypothetical protein GBAR_LOCUS4844 [Geodia barretti]|uniref:Uncharacterized protein n=1 Tax=Geodia barretti TaxID=519541 RepID=A0AA35W3G2_GEOBA|nr:hypothetical protein GBAR_LOCUS4844 [Geodia barretti]
MVKLVEHHNGEFELCCLTPRYTLQRGGNTETCELKAEAQKYNSRSQHLLLSRYVATLARTPLETAGRVNCRDSSMQDNLCRAKLKRTECVSSSSCS